MFLERLYTFYVNVHDRIIIKLIYIDNTKVLIFFFQILSLSQQKYLKICTKNKSIYVYEISLKILKNNFKNTEN